MRAVGTHCDYAPTRIIGPTDHAIGGAAQLALQIPSTAALSQVRAAPLLVTNMGRVEQPGNEPRRRRSRDPRDAHESAAGRMEQLADVGRSDSAASGLNDSESWPTRQSDARDSEPTYLCAVAGARAGYLLLM